MLVMRIVYSDTVAPLTAGVVLRIFSLHPISSSPYLLSAHRYHTIRESDSSYRITGASHLIYVRSGDTYTGR